MRPDPKPFLVYVTCWSSAWAFASIRVKFIIISILPNSTNNCQENQWFSSSPYAMAFEAIPHDAGFDDEFAFALLLYMSLQIAGASHYD